MKYKVCVECKRKLNCNMFYMKTKNKLRSCCKTCMNIASNIYRKKNILKFREYSKTYRSKNKDKVLDGKNKWRNKNKDYHRNYLIMWRAHNLEKTKLYKINRRSRQLNAPGILSVYDWNVILEKYKYKCAYCGKKQKLTKDHVIPLSKGGSNFPNNIVPACQSCNSKKGTRILNLRNGVTYEFE